MYEQKYNRNTKTLFSGGSCFLSEIKSLRLFPFTMAPLWNEAKCNKMIKTKNALNAIDS